MAALNIQAAQNETDEACMVQEVSCMTKEEMLSGFDNALHELKSYREGKKLELKPLEDVLNELSSFPSLGTDLGGGLRKVYILSKWQKIILIFSLLFKKK